MKTSTAIRITLSLSLKLIIMVTAAVCDTAAATASAAQILTVTGEATYYDNGTRSRLECMRLAAEEARINALAKEFGTVVSQNIIQTDRVSDNREHNDFLSLSSSEVRGEWLGDEDDPQYEVTLDKDGNFIVKCKIKGKARAISNESAEFEALVLRNKPDKKAADNHFRDQDDMFLYFLSGVDGFLTAYLQDENDTVLQLLPYTSDAKTRIPVRGKQEYIFFSKDHRGGHVGEIDELSLTAPDKLEYNRIYVIFSPKYFSPPVMSSSGMGLSATSTKEFTKWLAKARRIDPEMGVKTMTLEISPK